MHSCWREVCTWWTYLREWICSSQPDRRKHEDGSTSMGVDPHLPPTLLSCPLTVVAFNLLTPSAHALCFPVVWDPFTPKPLSHSTWRVLKPHLLTLTLKQSVCPALFQFHLHFLWTPKKKKPQLFPVASDLLHRCELLLSLCVCVCVKVGGVVKRQTEHKSKWDRQQEREREGKKRKEGGGPGVYSVNTQSTIESRAWSPSLRWKLIDRLVSHLESTEIYRKPKRNHEQSRSLYQLHYIWKTLLFFSFFFKYEATYKPQAEHTLQTTSKCLTIVGSIRSYKWYIQDTIIR